MSTTARRYEVPVAVKSIGGPPGTIIGGPPARPNIAPCGVSRHDSPAMVYQASGPECVCIADVMPGVEIASMYIAACRLLDRKGTDHRHPLAGARTPGFFGDRQQPDLAQRLDDGATCVLRSLRRGARRIRIQMPEDRTRRQLSDRVVDDDPAPELARALADRLALRFGRSGKGLA